MTDDIKRELDAQLPQDHVPINFDIDATISTGQRTAKRRTMWVAGGSTVSVIAILALAATILTPLMGQGQPTAGSPPADTGPPVELDPDKKYIWAADGGSITQETSPYLEAFLEHMETRFPDTEVKVPMADTATKLAESSENEVAFVRQDMNLTDAQEQESSAVFDRTAFVLTQNHSDGTGKPQPGESEGLFLRLNEEGDFHDQLNIVTVPAGSFALDTEDAIDLAACNNDSSYTEYHSCEAQEATGPNGETMREVTMETKNDGQSAVEAGRAAVLQRDDGSGVVVSDETSRAEQDEPGPALDFAQLSDIALALPESPIE